MIATLRALFDWTSQGSRELSDLLVRRPALEDVYLSLTEDPQ